MKNKINILQKQIRALVIYDHLSALGVNKCVCFTCGNASRELMKLGLNVTEIGQNLKLSTDHWYTYTEIIHDFNGLFDATSGHLNLPLMKNIAVRLKSALGEKYFSNKLTYEIPCGSGETFICLSMAYPKIRFTAIYNCGKGTEYNLNAPLNNLVEALSKNE